MPNAPIRILIVAALCIAALIGLVVRESMARDGGQEVQLAMGAIDPRALLQGHYVIVALQDRLANEAPCPASLQHGVEGDPRHHWLALSPNGPRHTISGQAASREEAMRLGALAVRGTGSCVMPAVSEGESPEAGIVQADIGISRFHIRQAEAERIERVLAAQRPEQETRAYAIVSIGADGRARLKGLNVEGERLMLNWW